MAQLKRQTQKALSTELQERRLQLREAFDRATAKPIEPDKGARINYLVFILGSEFFAWPAAGLTRILLNRKIVLLPGRQDSHYGVINYKNQVLSVTNLHHRFGLDSVQPDDQNIVLISKGLRIDTALLVDDLTTIVSVAEGAIRPKPISLDPKTAQMIVGEFFHQGQMVTVLNSDAFSG